MLLWRFILPLDRRAVVRHLGAILLLLGMLLLVPALVAIGFREWVQAVVLVLLALGASGLGWLSGRRELPPLPPREAVVVTALAYPLAALLGTVVLATVATPVDALFESMSGFTTTGLSMLQGDLPRSLLFFRSYAQWLGGAGIIVLSLAVLAESGSTATKLYTSESGEEEAVGSVLATGRIVAVVYAGVTVAAFGALVAAGAGWFDALLHALSLVSTGGFSPFEESIGGYGSSAVAGVTILFMILGALSFPLYYLAWRDGWRRFVRDPQLRLLLLLIVVGTLVAVAFEGWGDGGLLSSLFHVTSAATGTGFSLEAATEWAEGTRFLALAHMMVGGSVGSTTGGLKLLRVLALLLLVAWVVVRVMVPREAQVPLRIQRLTVPSEELRRAFALTVVYAATIFVSALLLTATGTPMEDALFEATSATNTVGLSAGVTDQGLPSWAKIVLVVDMWAGRVEVLPLLLLLHPANWRPNRQGGGS